MTPHARTYLTLLIGVIVILGILSFIPPTEEMKQKMLGKIPTSTEEVQPATNNPGWETYENSDFGFSISYPAGITPETTFQSYYHLTKYWRAGAFGENPVGVPVIAFPLIRIQNERTYPRYFGAEVRIGVSKDVADVTSCLTAGNGEEAGGEEIINGVKFLKFNMQDGGMMQYMFGVSYRTIHNKTCYAMEQLKTGSSYRDDPKSENDVPDEVLNNYYDELSGIISTFTFTK